jgi:predicted  nucleic acid-binding Zn-ribbon protein
MTDDRADLMLEILKNIQADVSAIKREQASQGIRLHALEDHQRGIMTSIFGIQADISDLKDRVDRIEKRLGLLDTEH